MGEDYFPTSWGRSLNFAGGAGSYVSKMVSYNLQSKARLVQDACEGARGTANLVAWLMNQLGPGKIRLIYAPTHSKPNAGCFMIVWLMGSPICCLGF